MTNADLFDFMRGIVLTLVPAGMPVIRAYPDAPAPKPQGGYIALEDDAYWNAIGQRTDGDNTDGWHRVISTDYEVKFVIWEMRGEGENLRNIIEGLQKLAVRQAFADASVSLLRTTAVNRVPSLQDKAFWTVNHRIELTLGVTRGLLDDVPSITAVGIKGEVEAGDTTVDVDIEVVYTDP